MVWWRFAGDIDRCFLAMGCYFLVRKNGDKWENIRIKIKLKSGRI